MAKTGVMNFYAITNQLLNTYGDDVRKTLQEVIPDAAKYAVSELRTDSRKRTGMYAKDWASKVERTHRFGTTWVVYNRKHYRVAHLLENDHGVANKYGRYGSVAGDGVIAKVEEKTGEWTEEELLRRLTGDWW